MSILLLTGDLACSSQVAAAGTRAGINVEVAMSPARLLERAAETAPRMVILDLNMPGLECREIVPQLKGLAIPPTIIAFGPHVHEARLATARAAGCDQVLARGQFYATLDKLLTATG
jgi:DNA-binding response OmpR family regulator